jgi:predicted DNA-binding transcriptional regulator AlpA
LIGHQHELNLWLTRKQTADYLGLSVGTLANWASMDIGPGYTRMGGGRVLYRMAEVESWLAAQQQKASV